MLALTLASCKKDHKTEAAKTVTATPTKLGLYEAGGYTSDNTLVNDLIIPVTKVGTATTNYDLAFDTGSGGLVLDATDLIPSTMYSSNGFNFTGDSTVINGITITNQTSTIQFGTSTDLTTVYGNLAYASITLGDTNGNISITRVPFFLYYDVKADDGTVYQPHDFDIFGVLNIDEVTFKNGVSVTSPLMDFNPGTGLTKGFKLAALGTANFVTNGQEKYVANVLTLGLTQSDLSSSSGFTMHTLDYYLGFGADPYLPSTVGYGSKSVSTYVLFDTGTNYANFIEDATATSTLSPLAAGVNVSIATKAGFNYSYTTASNAPTLTYIENPGKNASDSFSIFGIQFFYNNEYLLDYTDYKMGIKTDQ